jgi:hypothetical protein
LRLLARILNIKVGASDGTWRDNHFEVTVMDWTRARLCAAGIVMSAALVAPISAQTTTALGSVRLPRAVVANGQPLAAGTYTLRMTTDPVTSVVGQGPDAAHWVEFVQGGQVKGKELASIVTPADTKLVAKRTPPAAGRPLVQMLKGADYLRVWVNRDGTQYLVHLGLK